MSWSVDTLGAQILGELNQDRNASGGSVPDRLENLIKEALRYVWSVRDWNWQLKQANLSITAADTFEDLPADFREMHSWELQDVDESETLVLTADVRRWLEYNQTFDSTDTGHPVLGCIVRKTAGDWVTGTAYVVGDLVANSGSYYLCAIAHTAGTFATDLTAVKWVLTTESCIWQVKFAPKSDDAYVFPYIYLPKCPIDLDTSHVDHRSDSEVLIMPEPFHEGWHLRALYKAHQRFGSPEKAAMMGAEFNSWLQTAVEENNEMITDNPDPVKDGYGDYGAVLGLGDPRAHDASVLPGI